MIYCPHCRRPAAQRSGPCPHCGGELSGAPAPNTVPEAEAVPPIPQPDPQHSVGEGQIALQQTSPPAAPQPAEPPRAPAQPKGDGSGLQLEVVEMPRAQPLTGDAYSAAIDEFEVREFAGFGPPPSGPVGTVRYWLAVRRRTRALAQELEQAQIASGSAERTLLTNRAELGRRAAALKLEGGAIKPLIAKALTAQGELKGIEREQLSLQNEHSTALEALRARLVEATAAAEPVHREAALAQKALDKKLTDQRRSQAKVKRSEIELRNLDSQVQRCKALIGDPKTSPDRQQQLLADSMALDEKRAALLTQLENNQSELAGHDVPIAEAQETVAKIAQRLAEKTRMIDGIEAERKKLEAVHQDRSLKVSQQVDGEFQKVEKAWAQVGQQLIAENPSVPELDDLRNQVLAARKRAHETKRQLELTTRAQGAFDKSAVARAKQLLIGGSALLLGLIVAALYLLS